MNKLKQTTTLSQRKVLSQQTRQAIRLLQLNSYDLEKEVDNLKVLARLIFFLIAIPILTFMFGVTLLVLGITVMILFIEDIILRR